MVRFQRRAVACLALKIWGWVFWGQRKRGAKPQRACKQQFYCSLSKLLNVEQLPP